MSRVLFLATLVDVCCVSLGTDRDSENVPPGLVWYVTYSLVVPLLEAQTDDVGRHRIEE